MKNGYLSHLSGGFDSVAATILTAEKCLKEGGRFSTVFYRIRQPYVHQERSAAEYVSKHLKEKYPNTYEGHHEVGLDIFQAHNNHGPTEYVPVRNLVLGASSANIALSLGYQNICVGNKTLELRKDDPYCFFDCSLDFYTRLGDLSTFASQDKKVRFLMPLIVEDKPLSKEQVMEVCIENGVDLRKLWSCYNNSDMPCKVCYHCEEVMGTKYAYILG